MHEPIIVMVANRFSDSYLIHGSRFSDSAFYFPYYIKIIQIEYANSFIVLFSERETLILLFLYNFVNQPVNSSIVCFVAPEKICQL